MHEKRDLSKAERFKRHFFGSLKNLPLKADKPVKVWFADQNRYGLLPNLRRVWTKRAGTHTSAGKVNINGAIATERST